MKDRRSFLASLAATGAALTLPQAAPAPIVEATPSIFFSHSNNLALVRFSITAANSPAGRLRVYDRSGRFLGTAGIIAANGKLYGEFWIPVDGVTTISTDLELPGRNPLRTVHRLVPAKKWTLRWTTLADPVELAERLARLNPEQRASETEKLRSQRFLVNPVPGSDYEDLLLNDKFRYLAQSMSVAQRLGIPLADVAMVGSSRLSPSLPVLMLASGVPFAITSSADPVHWIEGPGGNRILGLGVGATGNPMSLGFHRSTDAMAPLIERFLHRQHSDTSSAEVLVAGDRLGTDRESVLMRIEEWNGRYAFPHIEISDAGRVFQHVDTTSIPTRALGSAESPVPDATQLRVSSAARIQAVESAGARLLAAASIAGGAASTQEFTDSISLSSPGLWVLNPTPYTRSDVARKSNGGEFVATFIPAMGYAYIPGSPAVSPASVSSALWLEGDISMTIDPVSGAISSVVDSQGRQWVRPAGAWNAMGNTSLRSATREIIPGLGTRFRLRRWSSTLGRLETVITVYDDLPWIDISNDCHGGDGPAIPYGFDFNLDSPSVSWDLTANSIQAPAPVGRMKHDRFVTLSRPDRAVHYRCFHSPHFSVDSTARLTSYAPKGRCDIRIAIRSGVQRADDSHRFGWGSDPFTCIDVAGNGERAIASFGSLLTTDRADVLTVGLRPAADGRGMIVYLQDIGGVGGRVMVRSGIMSFDEARQCDLLERDGNTRTIVTDGEAGVQMEPNGISVVRLMGLCLR